MPTVPNRALAGPAAPQLGWAAHSSARCAAEKIVPLPARPVDNESIAGRGRGQSADILNRIRGIFRDRSRVMQCCQGFRCGVKTEGLLVILCKLHMRLCMYCDCACIGVVHVFGLYMYWGWRVVYVLGLYMYCGCTCIAIVHVLGFTCIGLYMYCDCTFIVVVHVLCCSSDECKVCT